MLLLKETMPCLVLVTTKMTFIIVFKRTFLLLSRTVRPFSVRTVRFGVLPNQPKVPSKRTFELGRKDYKI